MNSEGPKLKGKRNKGHTERKKEERNDGREERKKGSKEDND